jgi:DNA-binding beta-propeller fold protein YncE
MKLDAKTGSIIGDYPIKQGIYNRYPNSIAVDGAGNVWIVSIEGDRVFEMNGKSGVIMKEYRISNWPTQIAIDNKGDVWVTNNLSNTVTEICKAAMPIKTPLVLQIK